MRKVLVGLFLVFLVGSAIGDECPVTTWSYKDQAAWKGECQSGNRQSPVNIGSPTTRAPHKLVLDYGEVTFDVKNTSRMSKALFSGQSNGGVVVDGVRYYLDDIHFHTPAEHRVGSTQNVMEMHVVNKRPAGDAVVIAVLFTLGTSSPALHAIINATPEKECDHKVAGKFALIPALIPWQKEGSNTWLTYDGSLTTPGCDPVVRFFILRKTIEVSSADRDRLMKLFGDTARDQQPAQPVFEETQPAATKN